MHAHTHTHTQHTSAHNTHTCAHAHPADLLQRRRLAACCARRGVAAVRDQRLVGCDDDVVVSGQRGQRHSAAPGAVVLQGRVCARAVREAGSTHGARSSKTVCCGMAQPATCAATRHPSGVSGIHAPHLTPHANHTHTLRMLSEPCVLSAASAIHCPTSDTAHTTSVARLHHMHTCTASTWHQRQQACTPQSLPHMRCTVLHRTPRTQQTPAANTPPATNTHTHTHTQRSTQKHNKHTCTAALCLRCQPPPARAPHP
jgi:hypothetical protein